MRKLYFCHTLYNLYITLVKQMVISEEFDLVIASQMPNYLSILPRLESIGLIRNLYLFDSTSYKKIHYIGKIDKILRQKYKECKYVEDNIAINLQEYDGNIYVYNDFEIIGFYLVFKRIKYHLIEDGLNFFQYCHKYYSIAEWKYNSNNPVNFIFDKLNIGHRILGSSKCAIDIEVNDINGIIVNKCKVVVSPRKELFSKLENKDKIVLYNLFCQGNVEGNPQTRDHNIKTMLLCTQPLYMDKLVSSMDDQRRAYEDILDEYAGNQKFQITIKPHPRDELDYNEIGEKYNCWVIDRYIPSEILNFNPNLFYDLALSITTTAIESLSFVKEKKYLGFEFVDKYR